MKVIVYYNSGHTKERMDKTHVDLEVAFEVTHTEFAVKLDDTLTKIEKILGDHDLL